MIEEYKLSEISRQVKSGLTPLRSNEDYWNDGDVPWLKTDQIGTFKIYDTNEKINKKALKETGISMIEENSVTIAMYGEGVTRGKVSIIGKPMTTNQACCNLTIDDSLADYRYVYYYLKNSYHQLRNLATGVRRNLNSNQIKNFTIKLPELKTQKVIADKLEVFDEKIELNNKLISKLEEYSRCLFYKWFVDFNFPNEQGKPYKNSGGEMTKVDGKLIPKGWEAFKFKDLFYFEKGVIPNEMFENNDGTKYPYLTIEFLEEGKGFFVDESPKLLKVKDLDIVMVMDGARSGKVFTAIDGYVGSTLAKIVPIKEYVRDIGFMFLKMREKAISSRTTGSTVPHTNKTYVNSLVINLPSDENELKSLTKRFNVLRKKAILLKHENVNFSEARDLLIKKLIK